ncbi:MAG: response regulator [Nitrospirae bacterium]|nr:response regulator [Nitrospirota bacterium]
MPGKDEAFLKRLLATFRVEAAEHIAAISSGLIEIEKSSSPEQHAEVIERLFREAHSMKGAARTVNLVAIESLCQSLESVLSALKRKEIAPARELLDLLHRSVNVIEGLLSNVGKEDAPSGMEMIRDFVRELDEAVKTSPRQEAKESGERVAEQQPEARTPAVSPVTAETMRVSKQRLDSILLRTEELLTAKQAAGQRASELREIREVISSIRKGWTKNLLDMRAIERASKKRTAVSSATDLRLNKLLSFLESGSNDISVLYDAVIRSGKAAESDNRSIAAMVDGLLDEVKTASLLPFSYLLEIMPKIIRDLSRDRGKEAELTIKGGEIEIDRRVLDEIRGPLIHLVRNSIDHGIEKPEERAAKKKPLAGAVKIDVTLKEGKSVEVLVSDDGAGIDTALIRNAAVKAGLLSKKEADTMDDRKLLPLIFRSGLTTSPIITDISGRGLGLAIVQERVEKLGGDISCETAEGKGTMFRILLPLTLATFRGVHVRVDDRHCIIPLTGLDRTVRVRRDQINTVENRETISVEGRAVPLVSLGTVLELPRKKKAGPGPVYMQAAVLGSGEQRIAFRVDDIVSEQEVLVKDLGSQLVRVRNVSGATVLGTGRVVPVLNVSDLLKSAVRLSPGAEARITAEEAPAERKSVLVVEDSITARTLLKNILAAAGYDVQTAVDGVDAFTALKTGKFDIVISDIEMPRMNGLDLTAKIRSDAQLAEVPVVLVTALESREDRERGVEVGANAYIVKSSFDQSNLLEVIKRLI